MSPVASPDRLSPPGPVAEEILSYQNSAPASHRFHQLARNLASIEALGPLGGNLLDRWKGRTAPCGIFVDNDGTVFVAEGWSVTILSSDGEFLSSVPLRISADDAGHGSHSVWVDSRGDLYAGEVGRENLIHKFKRVVSER